MHEVLVATVGEELDLLVFVEFEVSIIVEIVVDENPHLQSHPKPK